MPGSFIKSDLSAIFSENDLGTVADSDRGVVTGIFENGEWITDDGYGREVSRRKCSFTTKTEHGFIKGDSLTIDDESYVVMNVIDDGTGVSELVLRHVN